MNNESNTPKYNALIEEILKDLVPHKRVCTLALKNKYCEKEFFLENEDIQFLKMFRVPAPEYCPTCRRMMRLAHMGTMKLFYRDCNAPEHAEKMISIFGENCPFPIYDYSYFIGDSFDAFSFGREFDSNLPVLDQLLALRKIFPMPSFLNRDPSSINSDYSNGGRNTKNAYLCSGCYSCEDISYTNMANKSRYILDSRIIKNSEYVYQSIMSDHLYKCSYTYFSKNCMNSMFLYDCRNCIDCFGCVNLRNKSNCIFNVQYSKEDYHRIIASYKPFSKEKIEKFEREFWDLVKSLPMNASQNISTVESTGVLLEQSKNVYNCVDTFRSENIRYGEGCIRHNDSMDILFSGVSHHLYMCTNIGSESSNVKFSVSSKFSTDSEFIFNCKNVSNCFMCFGLQNKSYCILNKQYSKEEYFDQVDMVKSQMLKNGEYGQPLPLTFSAQAYNFSMASISFPLTHTEIESLGGYTQKDQESNISADMEVLEYSDIPQYISDVDESILDKAIVCEETKKPFKIIPSELNFYKIMDLPLPYIHPIKRMNTNYHVAANGKMHQTICQKCEKSIFSIFDPKENYKLYCEKCYQQEVN